MSLILAVHHASVVVQDTETSLGFYRDVLGLGVDPSRPDMSYDGAWLNLPDGRQIHLLELPNPDPIEGRPDHGGRDRHVALSISDLDELVARLNKAGIPHTVSASGRRACFCRDPDGNAVEFVESPAAG